MFACPRSMAVASGPTRPYQPQHIQYKRVNRVEDISRYRPGGYHPIVVGDKIGPRYEIVDKLGYGGDSTVWVAFDEKERELVALKVGVANDSARFREARIIQELAETTPQSKKKLSGFGVPKQAPLPVILDEFEICGPNGTHPCFTTALAQSDLNNKKPQIFPLQIARALAANLALALLVVHTRGFVHGDLRLTNVLVTSPPRLRIRSIKQFRERFGEPNSEKVVRCDGQPLTRNAPSLVFTSKFLGKKRENFTWEDSLGLVLNDYGTAFSPMTEQYLAKENRTPLYNIPPETLFEPAKPMLHSSDIWSLALSIWHIMGTKILIGQYGALQQTVAEQIDVLGAGSVPRPWWIKWRDSRKHLDDQVGTTSKERIQGRMPCSTLEEAFEEDIQEYRRRHPQMGVVGKEEHRAFLDLMTRMLRFRPEDRMTVEEVLQSKWMVKWALPELDRARLLAEKSRPLCVIL